jgi:methylthioribose-1-phosphate isomerase
VAAGGDVANKIGTYMKALAARETGVPFYAALPSSTVDWTTLDGRDIPIETRAGDEVLTVTGRGSDLRPTAVNIAPAGTAAANPAFDVTPAHLISGLITERGVCPATRAGLATLLADTNVSDGEKGLAHAAEFRAVGEGV